MPDSATKRVLELLGRLRGPLARPWDELMVRVEGVPRRARTAAAVAIAAAGIGLFVAGELPPVDDAARLVPGDALVYVHINAGRDDDQFERAAALAEGFPSFDAIADQALAGLARSAIEPVELAQLDPWLGDQVAFALIPDPARRGRRGVLANSLLLLEAADEQKALDFIARVAGLEARREAERDRYRDVLIRTYRERFVVAFVDGFVLIANRERPLRQAIDLARGDGASLAAEPAARIARGELPGSRVASAYVSRVGVRDLLLPQTGVLGTLGRLFAHPALEGVGIALVVTDDGLRVTVDRTLDPDRAGEPPAAALAGLRAFKPSLPARLPATALAYLGIADLSRTLQGLLDQVTVLAPGASGTLRRVRRQLARAENVDLTKEVLPLLAGETAFAFEAATGSVPVATAIVDGVEGAKAREALAKLQRPLAAALGDRRAAFEERELDDGVKAYTVAGSGLVQPTYALFDGMLVAGTAPSAVERVQAAEATLDGADLFRAATGNLPGSVSSLLFLDLQGLLGLAEFAGLGGEPAYARFRDDLRRLEALGLAVVDGERRSRTELNLVID